MTNLALSAAIFDLGQKGFEGCILVGLDFLNLFELLHLGNVFVGDRLEKLDNGILHVFDVGLVHGLLGIEMTCDYL